MVAIPVAKICWKPCWRIIPSRYPPVDLFERIAPRKNWENLAQIETLTNERVREKERKVTHVRTEDRVAGPGSSMIMAPFTHPDPSGDTFSDGSFGVCYASDSFETALEWSVRRREEFLRRTSEEPLELQMRVLNMDLEGTFHELRGKNAQAYDDHKARRELGTNLREAGSFGIVCDSLLSLTGNSIAIFRPSVLSNCRQERHLSYKWDGVRINSVYDFSCGEVIRNS